MNTTKLQAGAEATNRRTGSNKVTARRAEGHHAIPLLCALLVTLGGWRAPAAEATNNLVSKDISGFYTLVKVDGKQLPATVSHEGRDLQVRSGRFTINADGSCSSKMIFVPPSGREATVEVTATYRREGPNLDMQWQGAGSTSGTIQGDTFTMENEEMVLVYQRASGSGTSSAKIGTTDTGKH